MGTTRVLVLISVASLIAPLYTRTATAQTSSQATSAAGECEVAGTFKTTSSGNGLLSVWHGTLRFVYEGSPGVDSYILKEGLVTWTASGKLGDCTFSGGPMTFPAIMDPTKGDGGYLNVFSDGSYLASAVNFTILPDMLLTMTCPDYSVTGPVGTWSFQTPSDSLARVSDDGRTLKGTWTVIAPDGAGVTHEWHFAKSDTDPQLVVEIDEYDEWQPQAGRDEKSPANSLPIKARLQNPDGSPLCGRAEKFLFELTKASREPGVALNYPPKRKATDDYDLQFIDLFTGPDDVIGPDGQWIETPGQNGTEADATLSSFDWGAWGAVKITAHLPDARQIIGRLEGDESRTEILIPKRQDDSFIADQWKEDWNVTGLADDDDSENDPVGDGHVGDGLTLYEEYRGFLVNRNHLSGNPLKKDLFVYSGIGGIVEVGIKLFANVTGLEVHHRLRLREFDTDSASETFRRINFNHAEGPHAVDQHGIWIRSYVPSAKYGFSLGFGPPKNVGYIQLVSVPQHITRYGAIAARDYGTSHVAHELGHAVRIHHHGEGDLAWREWRYKRDPADTTKYARRSEDNRPIIMEDGVREVDVLDENDFRVTPEEGSYWVGVWGGQHSGVEDCVMRYAVARAYVPGAGVNLRIRYYNLIGEVVGMGLCDRATGTGVNEQGRSPRRRYGDATTGDCKSQICVNDKNH